MSGIILRYSCSTIGATLNMTWPVTSDDLCGFILPKCQGSFPQVTAQSGQLWIWPDLWPRMTFAVCRGAFSPRYRPIRVSLNLTWPLTLDDLCGLSGIIFPELQPDQSNFKFDLTFDLRWPLRFHTPQVSGIIFPELQPNRSNFKFDLTLTFTVSFSPSVRDHFLQLTARSEQL